MNIREFFDADTLSKIEPVEIKEEEKVDEAAIKKKQKVLKELYGSDPVYYEYAKDGAIDLFRGKKPAQASEKYQPFIEQMKTVLNGIVKGIQDQKLLPRKEAEVAELWGKLRNNLADPELLSADTVLPFFQQGKELFEELYFNIMVNSKKPSVKTAVANIQAKGEIDVCGSGGFTKLQKAIMTLQERSLEEYFAMAIMDVIEANAQEFYRRTVAPTLKKQLLALNIPIDQHNAYIAGNEVHYVNLMIDKLIDSGLLPIRLAKRNDSLANKLILIQESDLKKFYEQIVNNPKFMDPVLEAVTNKHYELLSNVSTQEEAEKFAKRLSSTMEGAEAKYTDFFGMCIEEKAGRYIEDETYMSELIKSLDQIKQAESKETESKETLRTTEQINEALNPLIFLKLTEEKFINDNAVKKVVLEDTEIHLLPDAVQYSSITYPEKDVKRVAFLKDYLGKLAIEEQKQIINKLELTDRIILLPLLNKELASDIIKENQLNAELTLKNAIEEKNVGMVNALLKNNLPRALSHGERTELLRQAVLSNSPDVALVFIKKGGNFFEEKKGEAGSSPFQLAIKNNQYDLLGRLIDEMKLDVNTFKMKDLQSGQSVPALTYAVKQNNLQLMQLLLQKKADVNLAFENRPMIRDSYMPLFHAIKQYSSKQTQESLNLIKYLLDAHADLSAKSTFFDKSAVVYAKDLLSKGKGEDTFGLLAVLESAQKAALEKQEAKKEVKELEVKEVKQPEKKEPEKKEPEKKEPEKKELERKEREVKEVKLDFPTASQEGIKNMLINLQSYIENDMKQMPDIALQHLGIIQYALNEFKEKKEMSVFPEALGEIIKTTKNEHDKINKAKTQRRGFGRFSQPADTMQAERYVQNVLNEQWLDKLSKQPTKLTKK